MGWDVKATADRVMAAVDTVSPPSATQVVDSAQHAANQVTSAIAANPGSFVSYTLATLVLMSIVGIVWRVRARLGSALEETMFANWRLTLLGTTGVVLSLASGYTTWDGMRNFTGEAVLSLMVTFGIQGVMLIVAWLIGESFAIGMNHQAGHGERSKLLEKLDPLVANVVGALIGIALFVALAVLILQGGDGRPAVGDALSWSKVSVRILIIVTGLLAAAFVALYAASDLLRPYLQSLRVIIKNSILWVMFLACMGTSVFFSFDSLFTAIFPQSERVRAAELRAQNQVAGIVADIEQKITDTRLSEAQNLFHTTGWDAYDRQLAKLAEQSRDAQATIDKYWSDQIEERNRAIKQQQERIATAQSGQAGLAGKKTSLAEELTRLKGDRPSLAADSAQRKADVEARAKDVDAKRVEAMAEAGGVEGTGKEGHGPVYRQRMDELAKLQATAKIADERSNDAKKRLNTVETRIAQIEREQSALDGDLAKLKGESETAEQRIKLTQEQLPSDASARIDPSRVTVAFENARSEFRQEPTQERLAKVQQLCTQIHTAMSTATPQTKKAVADIDCDPKQASEAASVVFALNAGTETFGSTCKGGERLNQYTSADALFGFARKCLADSGLPSKETDQLRTKINFIELNRDDKAHRFVVTWNAFQDGNRLAYLALAIAVAIDGLVFMSGLFGANAVRSPLSDVPSRKARSAQQLESTINAALGKMPYETAELVLKAMRPITNVDGFSGMIALDGVDPPTAERIRQVLTAGADIHAVEVVTGTRDERYKVRSELREYLSAICDRHFKTDKSIGARAKLGHEVAVALKPFIHEHADVVINNLHPMKPRDGFTSSVSLKALEARDPYDARIVRRVINAAGAFGAAAPEDDQVKYEGVYYFRPDLIHALQTLLATTGPSRDFESYRRQYLNMREQRALADGGALHAHVPLMAAPAQQRSLKAPDAPEKFDVPKFLASAGSGSDDAGNSQREFIPPLLKAIGIQPHLFSALSDDAFGAAIAASEVFASARRTNQMLDAELTERDQQAWDAMKRAYDALELTLDAGDTANRQRLKDAFQDLDQNWAILMLMPGGPYEHKIIEVIGELERAGGDDQLPYDQEMLLNVARQMRQAMQPNLRNSHAAWSLFAHALQAPYVQGHGSTPPVDGKRTLQ